MRVVFRFCSLRWSTGRLWFGECVVVIESCSLSESAVGANVGLTTGIANGCGVSECIGLDRVGCVPEWRSLMCKRTILLMVPFLPIRFLGAQLVKASLEGPLGNITRLFAIR